MKTILFKSTCGHISTFAHLSNYNLPLLLITTAVSLLLNTSIFAQAPEKMSYQAVVRNSTNDLVTNTSVGVQISILQGSATGTAVYVERQFPTTNANGLVVLEIGNGTVVTGVFSSIDWSNGPFFIKVETDIAGGANYTITGTSQLLSVPFALLAKTAATADYEALFNKPTLFDGQYSSLMGSPIFSAVATSGSYSDLTNKPTLFDGTWANINDKPTTIAGYGITDAMSTSHPASGIAALNITSWNTAYGWGNHAGLYRAITYVPAWSEITDNPFALMVPTNNQLLRYNGATSIWEPWTPDYLTSYSEADPIWAGVSSNYFTKTNLQTSGEASLHWDNITNINPNVLDLADGSLTGSKIGPGISVVNLLGVVPLTNGGTGASNPSSARANLELGALSVLNTVGSSNITDGAITSAKILDGTITSTDIGTETITASDIATGAVATTEILDGTIMSVDIGVDAITTPNIATGAITTAEILDGTITSADIGTDVIAAADIATGAVATSEILDGTITSLDIAAGAITSYSIADGTITTSDVNTITALKISGITNNCLPKSNGSGLVTGSFIDNGNAAGIGSISSNSRFYIVNNLVGASYGLEVKNYAANTYNYGIFGYAENGTVLNCGVLANAFGSATISSTTYGTYSYADGSGNTYGVLGVAVGSGINYGVYGNAHSGTTNWAGYFNGNAFFGGQIQSSYLGSATGTTMVIDASGYMKKLSSDRRLKENITALNNSLQKVLKLQGVTFTWKSDNEHLPDIGFIAQEVREVFPELVVEDKKDGLLSVKYQNVVAILTEAIKEQQKQIESQQKQIDELKQLVKNLMQK